MYAVSVRYSVGLCRPGLVRLYATGNADVTKEKLTLWNKITREVKHYVQGTKLLGYEMKISTHHLIKLISGHDLTRRESNQLKRTMSDIFRLIPFSAFVIIPFAELFLPVALKLFPNLLPSTYESQQQRLGKQLKLVEMKRITAKYLKETWKETRTTKHLQIPDSLQNEEMFQIFFTQLYQGKRVPSEEIHFDRVMVKNVARWFDNDIILDNLSRSQLIAMAKFISVTPWGNDNMLRMQIRLKLKNLIMDDKRLDYETVRTLTKEELYSACISRGIRTFGDDIKLETLRRDLEAWLHLRLRDKIPSVLLILSSTFTFNDTGTSHPWPYDNMTVLPCETNHNARITYYYNALLQVMASIPDTVYNMAKLDIHDKKIIPESKDVDIKQTEDNFKLKVLKEQEELIQREQQDANLRGRNDSSSGKETIPSRDVPSKKEDINLKE